MKRAFFVAATGQNVGKTTTCLGLVSGLQKRHASVGYLKPVGQEHVETETGIHVDKDVLLFHSHFQLKDSYEEMSPVLFPRGFTRDYLDGKVSHEGLVQKIERSFHAITARHPITVLEGTGHMGVGSIVNLNNAQVAAHLQVPLLLIASGGLGSSFDELELNRIQCEKHGVRLAGVILNRVLDEKRAMIIEYMTKALRRWNIPLLGCIPYDAFLTTPTMADYEQLFQTTLTTGEEFRWRHFENIRLVATSAEMYRSLIFSNQLIITPADREDIILATLTRYWDLKIAHPEEELELGLILTGKNPPKDSLIEQIRRAHIPMLYIPLASFVALKMIHSSTTKIRSEDTPKIQEAVKVVESHLDFDQLEKATM
ncbi:MAG: AAA family ATPase [Verrucomicrobiota bacterium]|nr:AAA family ATPase [Verrucomicrobiota bacterium]